MRNRLPNKDEPNKLEKLWRSTGFTVRCSKTVHKLKNEKLPNKLQHAWQLGWSIQLSLVTVQTLKNPRWSHYQSTLSNNVHQSQRQRLTKEPRRKRTGHRHGNTEKTSKQTNWRDNRSKQRPRPSIRNKRTVLSETMRRYKDLQLRANWIPGGHLRFQVLNSSAKCLILGYARPKVNLHVPPIVSRF